MPSFAGVPNLLKNAPKAIGITLLGIGVNKLFDLLFPGPTWGVFKVGTTDVAIEVSSVGEIDITSESIVSEYRIQSGSFTSYNKVKMPNITTIRLMKDGGEDSRLQLIYWLDDNVEKETLFDVLTPEWRYPNMTLIGYRISRSARSGAAMIVADCLFKEVRQLPATFSSSTIADPEDEPETPAARTFAAPPDKPIEVGGPVQWQ